MPRPAKSDQAIQTAVLTALNRDARLTPAQIGVAVAGGIVTLTGTVSRPLIADVAADVALSAASVRDVANRLDVEGDSHERNDTTIGRTIRHALGWNIAVSDERIDTIVCRGAVTLRGDVEHWYQREAAEGTVAGVAGVVSVHNQIQLLGPPTRDDILQEGVENALTLHRNCGVAFDGKHLDVSGQADTASATVVGLNVHGSAGGTKPVVPSI